MDSYHRHNWVEATKILCMTFPSVAQELGAPMMEHKDNKEWAEAERWRELEKYREGYRAYICACSAISVHNPNEKCQKS